VKVLIIGATGAHSQSHTLSTLDTPRSRASRPSEGPSEAYVCEGYEEPEVA